MKLQEADLDADSLPGVTEQLKDLALTAQRLEKASSENVKREAEIRRQERERILDEAQQAADAEGGAVTADKLREIIGDVYGV